MFARPLWFDGSLVGAVVTFLLITASAQVGIGLLLLNIAAFGCFMMPVIAALRDGDLDAVEIRRFAANRARDRSGNAA